MTSTSDGPGDRVDVDVAEHQALGRGHPDVAGARRSCRRAARSRCRRRARRSRARRRSRTRGRRRRCAPPGAPRPQPRGPAATPSRSPAPPPPTPGSRSSSPSTDTPPCRRGRRSRRAPAAAPACRRGAALLAHLPARRIRLRWNSRTRIAALPSAARSAGSTVSPASSDSPVSNLEHVRPRRRAS